MNRRLYQASMRYGSVILFVGFILTFVTAFVSIGLSYMQTMQFSSENYQPDEFWLLLPAFAIRSFVDAMVYASLLFLGSALLCRADLWLESAE